MKIKSRDNPAFFVVNRGLEFIKNSYKTIIVSTEGEVYTPMERSLRWRKKEVSSLPLKRLKLSIFQRGNSSLPCI